MSESGSIGVYGTGLGRLLRGVACSVGVTLAGYYFPFDGDGRSFVP